MPRTRKDPVERRTEILKHALQLFETQGYQRVTIEDIAHQCGIARTTMYEYFANKQQVLFALVEQISDELHLGEVSGSTCRDQLENLAAEYLSKVQANRSLYLLLFQESPALSGELSTKLLKWRTQQYYQVVHIAEKAAELGEMRHGVEKEDVGFMFQAVVGQRAGELLMTHQQVDAKQEAHRLVQLLWNGVGNNRC